MAPEDRDIHAAALKAARLTGRQKSLVSEANSRQSSFSYVLADANGITLARVPLEKCRAMQATLPAAELPGPQAQASADPPTPPSSADPVEDAGSSTAHATPLFPPPDLKQSDKEREFAIRLIPYALLFAILMGFLSCSRLSRQEQLEQLPHVTRYCYNKRTNTYYKPKFGESCSTLQGGSLLIEKGIMNGSRLLPFRR
jgi:hypothetical protein